MATEYYVDPTSGSDSTGNGTIGNPWKSIQYALNNITQDTTNGDRINVKAGASDDVLTATLTEGTYGTPTSGAPLIIQGYASAAGDQADETDFSQLAGISGGGSYGINFSVVNVFLRDLRMHNADSVTNFCDLGNDSAIVHCQFYDVTNGSVAGKVGIRGFIANCHVHSCSGTVGLMTQGQPSFIYACYVDATHASRDLSNPLSAWGGCIFLCNVVRQKDDAGAVGINMKGGNNNACIHNTVYCTGAAANIVGIDSGSASRTHHVIVNNYIEGFSGSSNTGILITNNAGIHHPLVAGNRWYNCTTGYSATNAPIIEQNNAAAAQSLLTDPSNENYSPTSLMPLATPTQYRNTTIPRNWVVGAIQRVA